MKLVVAVLLFALAAPARAEVDFSDTPAWTETGRVLLLWDVGPDRKNPKDPYGDGFGLPLRPVELVAQLGKVTRRIKLPPETGNLVVYNQVICKTSAYPLAGKEVAKLTFYEGGASGYSVVRAGQDLLEVHHWSQTDGACEGPHHTMVACPVEDELVARMHIPQDAKVGGGAIFLTEKGKQTKLDCGAER
jgi:hypothetical protein